MYKQDDKNTISTIRPIKQADEFHKLRNLALELKKMQLQLLKDLHKKELIK